MAKRKRKRASSKWTGLLLGLLAVSAAGVVGLVVLRDHLNQRPHDLEPLTAQLAARFEQTLKDGLVPADAIRLTAQRTERGGDAVWNVYQYEVEIPETLALSRMGELLRRSMASEHAVVQDTQHNEHEIALSLQVADHEFLIARLYSVPKPAATAKAKPAPAPVPVKPAPSAPAASAPEEPPLERLTAMLPWPWMPDAPPSGEDKEHLTVGAPRLAIILDDGGYGGEATEMLLGMDPRLTLSILPYTPEARTTAERGAAAGFQIMLHMPMESNDPGEVFQGSLMTTMGATEIEALLARALDDVPHAAGINNHTGSKFTESKPAVTLMLDALRRRGLFFIDSRTIHTTVAMPTACAMGVSASERDVFLDHDNTREFIAGQWDALIALCRERGHAIGIGHFRTLTLEILAEKLPELDDLGIELVHAGDLAVCPTEL